MTCRECLPPEVIVRHREGKAPLARPNDTLTRIDGRTRIVTCWDFAATPYQGRWKIYVDIYQEEIAMIEERIAALRKREQVCWDMSEVFLHAKDAHGLHDMGVEIQGIQWAIRELENCSV
jgi:hypothetical protein